MSVAAISDPLASRTRGRVMADYRVLFFNNLVNSYGKPFKCLQRATQRTQEKRQKKQNANLSDLRMSPIGNTTLNS
jgi:hypothetical protein